MTKVITLPRVWTQHCDKQLLRHLTPKHICNPHGDTYGKDKITEMSIIHCLWSIKIQYLYPLSWYIGHKIAQTQTHMKQCTSIASDLTCTLVLLLLWLNNMTSAILGCCSSRGELLEDFCSCSQQGAVVNNVSAEGHDDTLQTKMSALALCISGRGQKSVFSLSLLNPLPFLWGQDLIGVL